MRFWCCSSMVCAMVLCVVGTAASSTIPQIKMLGDGNPVTMYETTVTYAGDGFFYVQEATGAGGIRVELTDHETFRGATVDIAGVVSTNSHGERVVLASTVAVTGTSAIRPVYMGNRYLGGGDWNYLSSSGAGQMGLSDGFGANNIGVLVKIHGRVMQGAPGDPGPIFVDDGCGVHVHIALPPQTVSPGFGATVAATGVLSLTSEYQQVTGPFTRTYATFYRRVILATDMQVVQPAPQWRYSGEMVYIPAGSFLSGNNGIEDYHDQNGYAFTWEFPQHTVYMSGYWIGKYEVTRGEYRQFMDAGGYDNRAYWSERGWQWKIGAARTQPAYWTTAPWNASDLHPVVGVTYYECEAFTKWAGGHMTTKAQWEKAARWTGTHANTYPWGDEWDVEKCNNYDDSRYPGLETAPVGSYPDGVSPYGCYDMAGNVWERCFDWFGAHYFERTPSGGWLDPQGPPDGSDYFYDPTNINKRVVCGGAAGNTDAYIWCRSTYTMQDWQEWKSHPMVGFRMGR